MVPTLDSEDFYAMRPLAEFLDVGLVDPAFEVARQFDRETAFAALVDVVERAAARRVDADHAALEHGVEIALPRSRRHVQLAWCCGRGGCRGRAVRRRQECQGGERSLCDVPTPPCHVHAFHGRARRRRVTW